MVTLLQHPEQLWWVTGVCKAPASMVLLVSHGLQDSPGHQSPLVVSCLSPCETLGSAQSPWLWDQSLAFFMTLRSVQAQGVLASDSLYCWARV